MTLLDRLKKITTFVFDVDGVLTDGTVYVFPDKEFIRSMHTRDGFALQLAVKKGYRIVIISGGNAVPVEQRLQGLGIRDVFMSIKNKENCLQTFLLEHQIPPDEILFMGDDIPDYDVMKIVGIAAAPADAVAEIKSISHYISTFTGGKGCVRDVIEKVMKLRGDWDVNTSLASI